MNFSLKQAKERCKQAQDILMHKNVTSFSNHNGPLLKISGTYAGVWLEHAYDPLLFAQLFPEQQSIAVSQVMYFFENQTPDGQLPALLRDPADPNNAGKPLVSYRHIQECVSFAGICYKTYQCTNDTQFLKNAYARLCAWDNWLCQNRMTQKTGLIELFCEYDTGHDNALRLKGIPHNAKDMYGKAYDESVEILPLLAPDMNAVFYGDRKALAKMAKALHLPEEAAAWEKKALDVKSRMLSLLYNKEDNFFYDRDKNGNWRKFKTIQIANVFQEQVLDQDMFDSIYTQYFKSDKHFDTPIPFPAASISDPVWIQNAPGNSWNFYAQTLVALRTSLWMEHYGKTQDYEDLLKKWLCAYTASPLPFGQEFHPITGAPSDSSPYYSSAMLLFIYAMRRLGYISPDA